MAVDRDSYIQFYPSDWRGDECLSASSIGARGLWTEFMCLAHKEGGFVRVNGQKPDDATLARLCRVTPAELKKLTQELLDKGVASRMDDGTVYSRRMVRDAIKRNTNRKNGKNGGNPDLLPNKPKSVNRTSPKSDKPLVEVSDKAHIPALTPTPSPTQDPEHPQTPVEVVERSFDLFWQSYPRKVGRAKAHVVWHKLNPNDTLVAAILNALVWQKRQKGWLKDGGEFIPHPTTYLQGRRWEDAPNPSGGRTVEDDSEQQAVYAVVAGNWGQP